MTETTETSHTYPLVGAHYRRPAPAILSVLKSGTPLTLRPDPFGEPMGVEHDDPTAIAVLVSTQLFVAQVRESEIAQARLREELLNSGHDLEELLTQFEDPAMPEFHLAYIPRVLAAKVKLEQPCQGCFILGLNGSAHVIF